MADRLAAGAAGAHAAVARVTGYSVSWVRRWRGATGRGRPAIGDRRHANPGAAPLLARRSRSSCGRRWRGPAPDGGVWTCRKVAAWMSADARAAGQRAARLGVDAPARLHAATPAPARDPGRSGGAGGVQKGGLAAALAAVRRPTRGDGDALGGG